MRYYWLSGGVLTTLAYMRGVWGVSHRYFLPVIYEVVIYQSGLYSGHMVCTCRRRLTGEAACEFYSDYGRIWHNRPHHNSTQRLTLHRQYA